MLVGKVDLPRFKIPGNLQAEDVSHLAHLRQRPTSLKLGHDMLDLCIGLGCKDKIIDVRKHEAWSLAGRRAACCKVPRS